MRLVFAEMVVDGVENVGGRKQSADAHPDWMHSVAAGFHSALLYKISALCLLKAFARARAIARIRLHRRKAAS